ncbi:MAG: hypothetical protein JWM95_1600 [Gemmatimonadetes bacterium]|nr:hypothetical protein [Gemmatimonadota bacterium]
MNLYGFAGGDPVTYSDPFGLWPILTGYNALSTLIATRVAQKAEEFQRRTIEMAMGVSAGLEEVGESAIEGIARTLTERFGEPTAVRLRTSGALQREWTNVKTGVKHILAGPEVHEIKPGGGPVEHYNYEQQVPSGKPGKFNQVNDVHLDANGYPINGQP